MLENALSNKGKIYSAFIFDDEDLFTKPFARALRKKGFKVHTAKKKDHAEKLVSKEEYDVYCIDIKTGWSPTYGFDLIDKIRNKNPKACVDVVSAHRQYKKRAKQIGVSFSDKPIDHNYYFDKLLKLINVYSNSDQEIFQNGTNFDKSLSEYLIDAVRKLDENQEIRFILIDIFGKEIPELESKVRELEEDIGKTAENYIKGTEKILKMKNSLIGD